MKTRCHHIRCRKRDGYIYCLHSAPNPKSRIIHNNYNNSHSKIELKNTTEWTTVARLQALVLSIMANHAHTTTRTLTVSLSHSQRNAFIVYRAERLPRPPLRESATTRASVCQPLLRSSGWGSPDRCSQLGEGWKSWFRSSRARRRMYIVTARGMSAESTPFNATGP